MACVKAYMLVLCIAGVVRSVPENDALWPEEERVKRSDDAAPLQAVVDNLAQQLNTLKAQMAAQQAQITDQKSTLDKYGRVVAFHAWGGSSESVPISVTAYGAVILLQVATNIGNAYDPQTGFFTAPVSGLYLFHATFMNHDLKDQIHAGIHVDGTRVALSTADSRHGYWDNPAIAAIVHVTAGQKVNLRSENGEVDNFYSSQYTTFSGFLIRAD